MKKFTSDVHFRHRNIVNYTDRKEVTNAESHDAWAVDLWNREVSPSDDVYHLGDFCFSSRYEDVKSFVSSLSGHKHFILGNHDKEDNFRKLHKEGLIESYGHYKEIKIGDTKTVLFHFPITAWNRQHYGSWCLHGHCHSNLQGQGKILDVGLDMSYLLYGEHRFFTEEDIKKFMDSREVFIADGHTNRTGD